MFDVKYSKQAVFSKICREVVDLKNPEEDRNANRKSDTTRFQGY